MTDASPIWMRNRFSSKPSRQHHLFETSIRMDDDDDDGELEPMLDNYSRSCMQDAAVKFRRPNGFVGGRLFYHKFLILFATLVIVTLLLAIIIFLATLHLKRELINSRDFTYQQIADNFKKLWENAGKTTNNLPSSLEHDDGMQEVWDVARNAKIPKLNDPETEVTYETKVNLANEKVEFDLLCSRNCSNPRYTRHPVLMVSLDGFTHEYGKRNIVEILNRFKDCGASAEWMYSSYPTKTFPNHYTLVTGLYPEAHGIIDNKVHDPNLSDDLVDMRKSIDLRYYKGEPIWVTAAKHNITTACLFWAGCAVDFNGIQPTYNLPYNHTMSFRARINTLIEWLLLPENLRPSLLLAYFNQPDYAGHFEHGEKQVNESLQEIESALNYLVDTLSEHNLLGCLNIIILSDHGMQKLDRRFYVNRMLDTRGMIISSSVVARIELANSTMNRDEVLKHFRCKNNGTIFRIYDKEHIPKRYHYESSDRIGDFVIEGQSGTTFYATHREDIGVVADHGYDYIIPNMRTIFYAAGPSILPSKHIEPFQNIEIYNLIADLIGISDRAPNNGTYGRLHEILTISSTKTNISSVINNVEECSQVVSFRSAKLIACDDGCQEEEDGLTFSLSSCLDVPPRGHFGYSDVKLPYCYLSLCSIIAFFTSSRKIGHPRAIYEMLSYEKLKKELEITKTITSNCTFVHNQFDENCNLWNSERNLSSTDDQLTFTSLIVNPTSQYKGITDLQVLVYRTFRNGPLEILRKTIVNYVKTYDRLIVISGTVNDFDHDGLADDLNRTITDSIWKKMPTHIFAILIRCENSEWSSDGHSCKNTSRTNVLSFLLPNVPDDLNCLDPMEYLRVNTARIRDIELLSGLEFFTLRSHYPQNIVLQLRTYISYEMWPL